MRENSNYEPLLQATQSPLERAVSAFREMLILQNAAKIANEAASNTGRSLSKAEGAYYAARDAYLGRN